MPNASSGPFQEPSTRGMPGRPLLNAAAACDLVSSRFGIEGTASTLPSDRDQNFLVETNGGNETGATGIGRYVLKIANVDTDRALLEAEISALKTAAGAGLPVPRLIPTSDGQELASTVHEQHQHLVRLVTYLRGKPLAEARPQSPALLTALGHMLGVLDDALQSLDLPGAVRRLAWDPVHASDTISKHIDLIANREDRHRVQNVLDLFQSVVPSLLDELPRQIIHCDANDYNILVETDPDQGATLSGLLDFGDLTRTVRISELAVACAYAMLDKPDPIGSACHVVAGYHAVNPLTEKELESLYPLICGRLGISVCMSAFQKQQEPDNDYLTISEDPVWSLLRQMADIHPRLAWYRLREACGFVPFPGSPALVSWLTIHGAAASPVVSVGAGSARVFDFSVGSTEWPPESLIRPELGETAAFVRLAAEGVSVGVGRYDEARLVYSNERFLTQSGERRTVHLGLDLFQLAGSPVFAPFDGTLFSANDNDYPGDYGPTLILRHAPDNGPVFYSLYGHLSRHSLSGIAPGDAVAAGQQIASLGQREENGGWAPHLHFQVIGDLLDQEVTFIGVASPSQRRIWTSICPNPNLITRFPEELFPAAPQDSHRLLEARKKHIGPSLSLSYDEPLHIVRGYGQYLFDREGRRYLDAVNNVPHVGHAHPHVVRAGQRQMQTLNTNTRYLHDHLVRYAERLSATLPDPLQVVYFVNSGSEANDLALRMARAHSGARHTIVIEGAYHGNLSSLIEISPYKYGGKGGSGPPPTTHAVPMPDSYRGAHQGTDTGKTYAAYVETVARRLGEAGESVTFIAESVLSCGGQIFLPPGYLESAYHAIRSIGGVCIADEVQVGMGRMGSHFWGFEMQGVIPDIVTVGKPIGNGHPLGAVVTTPEMAASFANGMEYFNTFGGNPVSCAIGLAVLDIIEQDHLQERAAVVGGHLLAGLRELQGTHPIVGDVRGQGLFLGIELVTNRSSLEPATRAATYVVNRMKEQGVLLSTDGPLNNVIKIKPPLVFSEADADFLIRVLDRVLSEDMVTCHTTTPFAGTT